MFKIKYFLSYIENFLINLKKKILNIFIVRLFYVNIYINISIKLMLILCVYLYIIGNIDHYIYKKFLLFFVILIILFLVKYILNKFIKKFLTEPLKDKYGKDILKRSSIFWFDISDFRYNLRIYFFYNKNKNKVGLFILKYFDIYILVLRLKLKLIYILRIIRYFWLKCNLIKLWVVFEKGIYNTFGIFFIIFFYKLLFLYFKIKLKIIKVSYLELISIRLLGLLIVLIFGSKYIYILINLILLSFFFIIFFNYIKYFIYNSNDISNIYLFLQQNINLNFSKYYNLSFSMLNNQKLFLSLLNYNAVNYDFNIYKDVDIYNNKKFWIPSGSCYYDLNKEWKYLDIIKGVPVLYVNELVKYIKFVLNNLITLNLYKNWDIKKINLDRQKLKVLIGMFENFLKCIGEMYQWCIDYTKTQEFSYTTYVFNSDFFFSLDFKVNNLKKKKLYIKDKGIFFLLNLRKKYEECVESVGDLHSSSTVYFIHDIIKKYDLRPDNKLEVNILIKKITKEVEILGNNYTNKYFNTKTYLDKNTFMLKFKDERYVKLLLREKYYVL